MGSNIPQWIDNNDFDKVGYTGYLVRVDDTSNGGSRYSLRERPARTNRSAVPRLDGWCGEDNNRSLVALGVAKIVGRNRALDRARIARVTGSELAEFLSSDGYPELIPGDNDGGGQ